MSVFSLENATFIVRQNRQLGETPNGQKLLLSGLLQGKLSLPDLIISYFVSFTCGNQKGGGSIGLFHHPQFN